MIEVKLPNGLNWPIKKLLAKAHTNPKLSKDDGGGKYLVYGLSMQPQKIGGGNVCPFASKGCIATCLNEGGMSWVDNVRNGRLARKIAFLTKREKFLQQLIYELELAERLAKLYNKKAAVRLNVFSDIPWEKYGVPQQFPNIVFYDYTKRPDRAGWILQNYHVTFSRSENNETECKKVLRSNANVAVVFASKRRLHWSEGDFPKKFLGKRVIDGDKSDLRFLDPSGVIVALRAKGKARKDTSGFVVRN